MALFLAPAALGLGDLVVTLPVVQQLIARGQSLYLVVRAEEHLPLRRIVGLAGTRLEWELPQCMSPADRFIDLRDHPLQRAHWWGSKPFIDAYPGWTIDDILSVICNDKELGVGLYAPYQPLKFGRREELSKSVVFVPGSAVTAKCWPTQKWIELKEKLTQPVHMIGQPEESKHVRDLIDAGVSWYETPTIADALDAVSSCRAIVSVDTGIMHLAVHQGVDSVGLFRARPVYARECENFTAVTAERMCAQVCYELEISCAHNSRPAAGKAFRPADWSCAQVQSCMETITTEQVLNALTNQHDLRRRQKGTHRLPARS